MKAKKSEEKIKKTPKPSVKTTVPKKVSKVKPLVKTVKVKKQPAKKNCSRQGEKGRDQQEAGQGCCRKENSRKTCKGARKESY